MMLVMGLLVISGAVNAQSPKAMFFEAENAHHRLRNDAVKKKYRSHWLNCIKKYQAVHDADTKGPWAAAGLYMTGSLYWELYQHSYYAPDIKEAETIFLRVTREFPKSKYSSRAKAFLDKIHGSRKVVPPPVASKKQTPGGAKESYDAARACYESLSKDRARQKYRDQWMSCIRKFESVVLQEPNGPWAGASVHMTGVLYQELSGYSRNPDDVQKSIAAYDRVIRAYADSRYVKEAQTQRAELVNEHAGSAQNPKDKPRSGPYPDPIAGAIETMAGSPPSAPQTMADGKTLINGIRYWSNPNYTRVVIDANGPLTYDAPHLLNENPAANKPRRLYFDVHSAKLGDGLKKNIPINDNLLSAVRAAQYTLDSVRVVIDIKSYQSYKIFPLLEPSRIVVDVWGTDTAGQYPMGSAGKSPDGSEGKISPGALAKQLALGVRRIVIDPGHGGKDPGALGFQKGVYEKDITLALARRLSEKIKAELKCEVILTRTSDRAISLEERTAFANTRNADLFISLHTNAHKRKAAYGIETYFLNLATDDDSIRVAAMENATSEKNISDLHSILSDLMQNAKINESSRLAAYVQNAMVGHMKPRYGNIKDNGVKKAPFYVLLGAQMPAILVEAAFISNERECKRLINKTYQDHICDGIVKGIRNYIKETSPHTLSRK